MWTNLKLMAMICRRVNRVEGLLEGLGPRHQKSMRKIPKE